MHTKFIYSVVKIMNSIYTKKGFSRISENKRYKRIAISGALCWCRGKQRKRKMREMGCVACGWGCMWC